MLSISRRNFLKHASRSGLGLLALGSLSGISAGVLTGCGRFGRDNPYDAGQKDVFPYLEVSGSYYNIGRTTGSRVGTNISGFLQSREKWFDRMKQFTEKHPEVVHDFLSMAERYYPQYIEELHGLADGSGVPFEDLFLLNTKAEIGAAMTVMGEEIPGCSTIHYYGERRQWLFHNEDGHEANNGRMFVVKVTPPSGVTFVVLTYPGILMGNGPGLNVHGIGQTTNYIASLGWNNGIPRYFIGRAVLETRTLEQALSVVTDPARAFAYHHNLVSLKEKQALSVEVTPDNYQIYLPEGLYVHTNHLILEETRDFPQDMEYVRSSSVSRYQVIEKALNELKENGDTGKDDLMAVLSSHKQKPYSPCRHPEGDVQGRTLGTAIFDVTRGEMELYAGNPCRSYRKQKPLVFTMASLEDSCS